MPTNTPTSTPIIRLRPILPTDLPAIFTYESDPAAHRMAVVNPRPREAFDAVWARILANPAITARAILADDAFVGHISCFQMEGLDTIGYWIAREHWGRGIATRALALLLELIPTRPLHARAAVSNAASIRVLTTNGFQHTATQLSPATDRFPECEEAIFILP